MMDPASFGSPMGRDFDIRIHKSPNTKNNIIEVYKSGVKHKDIIERFGISSSALKRLIRKYHTKGNTEKSPGQGRKRKTSPTDDHTITRSVKKDPLNTAREVREGVNLPDVSLQTIRRRIKENGDYESYWAVRKPFISLTNIQKRLEWCEEFKHKPKSFWRRVLWTDESPYMLRMNVKKRVWRAKNTRFTEDHTVGTVKHDKKINVWGGFAAHGVGILHRIHGIMDKDVYNNILGNVMLPSEDMLFGQENWHFQQDNDPKHTAKINKSWIQEWNIPTIWWPAQSPDLNPIENLWSILDRKCAKRACKNEEQLFKELESEWKKLTPKELTNLVDSMPNRIAACIAVKGHSTKY